MQPRDKTAQGADDASAARQEARRAASAGRWQAAQAALRRALEQRPHDPALLVDLASALAGGGDPPAAIAPLRAAIGLAPDNWLAHANLGYVLMQSGAAADAVAALERARALAPQERLPAYHLTQALLDVGRAPAAVALARDWLEGKPADAGMRAALITALVAAGQDDLADEMAARTRYLRLFDVAREADLVALDGWHRELVAHAQRHPTRRWAPPEHATRGGHHTGNLLGDGITAPPLAMLESLVHDALADYLAELPTATQHFFLQHRPSDVAINLWSVSFESDGRQIPHIHPDAWLSGVYYAAVPDTVSPDDPSRRGWLVFGPTDREREPRGALPSLYVVPRPGLLVLFPSYLFHHTEPAPPGLRVSFAFDVARVS